MIDLTARTKYSAKRIAQLKYAEVKSFLVFQTNPIKPGQNAFCIECDTFFSAPQQANKTMNSSKFKQHLTKHHLQIESDEQQIRKKSRQMTLDEFSLEDKYIIARLSHLSSVIFNYLPFSSVHYDCVVTQFELIGCRPPSRTTVSDDLRKSADLVVVSIKQQLQQTVLFSVIFDLWESPCKDSILSVIVIVFFIDTADSGNQHDRIEKYTLDTLPLVDEASHDNVSYNISINEILYRYELPHDKLVCYVSDGANVNYCAARNNGTDIQRCSSHLLSLLVKDLCEIGHIFELFETCKEVRRIVYKSTLEKSKFKAAQTASIQESTRNIQTFSDTRWNDCLNLLESVNVNLPALSIYFQSSANGKEFLENSLMNLDNLQAQLPDAIKILKHIDNVIKKFSNSNALLGSVYYSILKLRNTIRPLLEEVSMGKCTDALEERCDELLPDEFIVVSAVLNPLRVCPSLNPEGTLEPSNEDCPAFDDAKEALVNLYNLFIDRSEDQPSTIRETEFIEPILLSELTLLKTQMYNKSETVLEFWCRLRPMLPHLYIVASVLNCIRPTSVDCERVFSRAKKFMRPDRCRMEPTTLDTCLFLQSNVTYSKLAMKQVSLKWRLKTLDEPESEEKPEE